MKPRPRPPTIITRVIVFLLLGAIVNVAVAWGCAYWFALDDSSSQWLPQADCEQIADDAYPSLIVEKRILCEGTTHAGIGRKCREVHLVYDGERYEQAIKSRMERGGGGSGPGDEDFYCVRTEWAGWPMHALGGDILWDRSSRNMRRETKYGILLPVRGLATAEEWYFGYILPLSPVWPGFAINTIFYAAILWLLFFAPGKVRRTIRRRRGLCPACAYPIGTSPVCTECGKAVIPKSVGPTT